MTNNERDPVVEQLFDGLEPPSPPTDLRQRVLEAASASDVPNVPLDSWTRIWSHRGLRMAWAASFATLLASHVILGFGEGRRGSATAENQIDQSAVEFLRPVEISDNVRPIVGLFAAGEDPTDLQQRGESS